VDKKKPKKKQQDERSDAADATPRPLRGPSHRHSTLTAPQIWPGPDGHFSLRTSLSHPTKRNPSRRQSRWGWAAGHGWHDGGSS